MSESAYLSELIGALARQAVADYLAPEATSDNTPGSERPNHAPLSDMDKAA